MTNISELEVYYGSQPNKIRELFEYGKKRKELLGEDNVFDFSIGNPVIPCPKELNETLISLLTSESDLVIHGYSSSKGNPQLRANIIKNLNKTYGTQYTEDNIFITCGAAPALSSSIKSLITNKNQEIIIFAPYFPEYKVFSKITSCKIVEIPPQIPSFQINFDELEKAITKNTKILILNTPNNPSGTLYSVETLKKLGELLTKKEQEFRSHIYIISDEPYRDIIFNKKKYPFPAKYYDNTVVCYSFSKSVSIPGERVGYALVNPTAFESDKLINAIAGAERIMGHVCAPTLMQLALSKIIGITSDMKLYEQNRNILYKGLKELGYETNYPEGSFYMFLKCLEPDSLKFCEKAKKYEILIVPADSFGCPGYARVAFCVKKEMIEKSLEAFKKLKETYK